ncbi:hypothetical protein [Ornithinibacillus sp. FSL M8-0202]|uniref:hypothetical protein n=1 Tax=unclassified Ornithinibacillus TaxID=2620869 RepID=UPI0030CEF284
MIKRILLIVILVLLTFLVACNTSPEAEELAAYHNDYVENVNSLASQVDIEVQKSFATETPEETLDLQTKNVLPLISSIKEHIESQNPESEAVKELHNLRLNQLSAWEEAFNLQYQALEKTVNEEEEEEVTELLQQSDEKLLETAQYGQEADNKLRELAEKYNVSLNN